jgi:hypothetical protein
MIKIGSKNSLYPHRKEKTEVEAKANPRQHVGKNRDRKSRFGAK